MKNSEFVKEAEKLKFKAEVNLNNKDIIVSRLFEDNCFMSIDCTKVGDIDFYNGSLPSSKGEAKRMQKLYHLATDLAFTLPRNRKDEPKKYMIHLFSGYYGYLNYDKSKGVLTTTIADIWNEAYKCLFTEKEYNDFREAEMQAGYTILPEFNSNNQDVFVPMDPLEADDETD